MKYFLEGSACAIIQNDAIYLGTIIKDEGVRKSTYRVKYTKNNELYVDSIRDTNIYKNYTEASLYIQKTIQYKIESNMKNKQSYIDMIAKIDDNIQTLQDQLNSLTK